MLEADAGFRRVIEVFDSLGIVYMVGGSLASSIYGIPRTTQDIDLVADILWSQAQELSAALQPDFYADADAIEDAIRRGRAFNLIHNASGYKFDVFPVLPDEYSQIQLARRILSSSGFPVVTPEDIILMKLLWYRRGGEVSERQWTDARGVMELRRDRLDFEYMRRWAQPLGVENLLARLIKMCLRQP